MLFLSHGTNTKGSKYSIRKNSVFYFNFNSDRSQIRKSCEVFVLLSKLHNAWKICKICKIPQNLVFKPHNLGKNMPPRKD